VTEAGPINVDWTTIFAAVSLEVVIISSAVGIVWKLSRSEISIRAEAETRVAEAKLAATTAIKEVSDKVYQVEIWARDNFVRRDSFNSIIDRMEKSIERIGQKIDDKFDQLTKRVDDGRH
jgi:hypothetical protein